MADSVLPSTWQIPIDFTISKARLGLLRHDLTVRDALGNEAYRIRGRPIKTLFDADGNPLISAVHCDDGWQGFKGDGSEHEDLLFTTKKISDGQFKSELEIFLSGTDLEDKRPSFILKGSPYRRSCTIYSGVSIVAQTNPLYKLGKKIHSRHKFRLTVYPGTDHSLIIAMVVTFFG